MDIMDIVILVIIGIGVVWGLTKGFVRQLSSLVGLIVGLLVARALFAEVGDWMAPAIGVSVTVGRVISFFLLWIVVPLLFSLLASFLTRALQVIHLGWLNRLLGGALSGLKFMLLIGLIAQLIEFVDAKGELLPKEVRTSSTLYRPLYDFAGAFIPAVKDVGGQIMEQGKI